MGMEQTIQSKLSKLLLRLRIYSRGLVGVSCLPSTWPARKHLRRGLQENTIALLRPLLLQASSFAFTIQSADTKFLHDLFYLYRVWHRPLLGTTKTRLKMDSTGTQHPALPSVPDFIGLFLYYISQMLSITFLNMLTYTRQIPNHHLA